MEGTLTALAPLALPPATLHHCSDRRNVRSSSAPLHSSPERGYTEQRPTPRWIATHHPPRVNNLYHCASEGPHMQFTHWYLPNLFKGPWLAGILLIPLSQNIYQRQESVRISTLLLKQTRYLKVEVKLLSNCDRSVWVNHDSAVLTVGIKEKTHAHEITIERMQYNIRHRGITRDGVTGGLECRDWPRRLTASMKYLKVTSSYSLRHQRANFTQTANSDQTTILIFI